MDRDEVYAGSDLSMVEICAAKQHLENLLKNKGVLSGCTSYVQRKMGIGYTHAARIMSYLEAERFVSPADGKAERHFL